MYLTLNDYKKQIQNVNLQQIISEDSNVLNAAQLAAEAECISYLAQRYDVDKEFTDTAAWSYTATYKAGNRVYLYAPRYSASDTYDEDELTEYLGDVYRCTTAVTQQGAFDANKWDKIGKLYTLYYVKYPARPFDLYKSYAPGDEVFYLDRVYTAKKNSIILPHDVALQYRTSENVPATNVFPDDPVNGAQYWEADAQPYSVEAGTYPTDADYWTEGDNRNQQMVLYMIDVTLFHVHSRLAPNNIPQLRFDRYTRAIQWLQMAGRGDVTAAIPKIQPRQGSRVRYGGPLKNVNSY